MNDQLDKRIMSLNILIDRADALLSNSRDKTDTQAASDIHNEQEKRILALAKEGRDLENIADILSIPKEEVKLILDLKKRFSQLGHKEGAS